MLIPFNTFIGQVPRLPSHLLPDNAATTSINCDYTHGELRAMWQCGQTTSAVDYQIWPEQLFGATLRYAEPEVCLWTENGDDFYGWPVPTYPVKSMVQDDIFYRIYYSTFECQDGKIFYPEVKVARTHRYDVVDGKEITTKVINGLVQNYLPPETTMADAWTLGVPAPAVEGGTNTDAKPAVSLFDLPNWPNAEKVTLKTTFFVENTEGKILYEYNITNDESKADLPQVIWTEAVDQRGSKIQDFLWALDNDAPRPYKMYWFEPPRMDTVSLSRQVTITNDATSGEITFDYDGDPVDVPPQEGGGVEQSGLNWSQT